MKKTPTKKTAATKKPKLETPEAKVAEIEKGLVPLLKEAGNISITNEQGVVEATTFLGKVKGYAKRVTELQEFFTNPYVEQRRVALEQKNRIEAMFAPKLQPLVEIEKTLKRAIADYRLEEERKARAEEKRLQDIRDRANEKREEEGKGQILAPVKTVERAAPTVRTEAGSSTTKKVWKHEVQDLQKLVTDKEFLGRFINLGIEKGLHEQVLRQMVKEGVREVVGVRIYEDIDVSVSAN